MEVGRLKLELPIVSLLITLIGLIMVISYLFIKQDLDIRTYLGFTEGAFAGYSLPYVGVLFFSLGIFLSSITISKGSKGRIILLIMLVGFIVAAIGSIGLIFTYYQWYIIHDWPWVIDYYLLQNLVIGGLVIFFAAIALIFYSMTIERSNSNELEES